jgi:hypothetical protein
MLVLPWRGSDRAKQEVRDGEKAAIKAHEKSGEAAEEYSEQALALSLLSRHVLLSKFLKPFSILRNHYEHTIESRIACRQSLLSR